MWFQILMAGVFFMVAMLFTPPKIDFILKRAGAACFFTSGTHLVTSGGWLADLFRAVSGWLTNLLDGSVAALLGVSIVAGLLAAMWAALWLLAMVPTKWFALEYSDRMIYSGAALPFFIALIPDDVGDALRNVTTVISELTTSLVTGVV